MIKQLFRNGVASGVRLERFKDVMKLTTLDRDTLLCFISRIEVFEQKKVYVEFRAKEEFHKISGVKSRDWERREGINGRNIKKENLAVRK